MLFFVGYDFLLVMICFLLDFRIAELTEEIG
jgi:uncharacterized membrane protein